MFGKINSATPLEETNSTIIGSEVNAKMAIFTFPRGLTV
jgi:hypothetical protein